MQSFSTTQMMEEFRQRAKSPGVSVRNDGDAASAVACGKKIEAVYEVLSRAPHDEPLNCVVDLRADSCEIWTGSQFQTIDRANAAQVAELPVRKSSYIPFLGGGFDAGPIRSPTLVEAVTWPKRLGRHACKSHLDSRRRHASGWYRPAFLHAIEGGVDANGNPVCWKSRLVGQSIMAGTPFEAMC